MNPWAAIGREALRQVGWALRWTAYLLAVVGIGCAFDLAWGVHLLIQEDPRSPAYLGAALSTTGWWAAFVAPMWILGRRWDPRPARLGRSRP